MAGTIQPPKRPPVRMRYAALSPAAEAFGGRCVWTPTGRDAVPTNGHDVFIIDLALGQPTARAAAG